jgi:hypothetical protein
LYGGGGSSDMTPEELVAKLLEMPCMGCGKKFTELKEEEQPHCQICCFYGRLGSKCPGCKSEISKVWTFRPYGHRCIKCGWIRIKKYGKSWAVEDEEERKKLITLEEEIERRGDKEIKITTTIGEEEEEEKRGEVNANATGIVCLVVNGDDEEGTDAADDDDDDDCKQFLHPHIFHQSRC